jgi:hypothetical protein
MVLAPVFGTGGYPHHCRTLPAHGTFLARSS